MPFQLPWKDFIIIKSGLFFRKFTEKLKKIDLDWFEDLATSKNLSYLVTCEIKYNDELGLKRSIDFSDFPYFR